MANTIDLQRPMTPTAIVVALDGVSDAVMVTSIAGTHLRILKATYEHEKISTSLGSMTWTQITGFTRHQLLHAVRSVRIESMPIDHAPNFDRPDGETLARARHLISRHALTTDVSPLLNADDAASRLAALHLTGQRLVPRRGEAFSKPHWTKDVRSAFEAPHWLPALVDRASHFQAQILDAFMTRGISVPGNETLPVDSIYKTIRTMAYPFTDDADDTGYAALVAHEQRAYAACIARLRCFQRLAQTDFLTLPIDSLHSAFVKDHAQLVRHILTRVHKLKLNTYRSGSDPIWSDVIYGSMRPSEALAWSHQKQSLWAKENDNRARRAANLITKAADATADHVRPHIATLRACLRDLPEITIHRDKTPRGSLWVIEVEGFRLAAPIEADASPWGCQNLVTFIATLADHLAARNTREITYHDFIETTWKADAI